VTNADGADYVAQMAAAGERTDVVLVDAYNELGIASSVVEREFVENAKRILHANGVFVLNLAAEAQDCHRYVETIRRVFASPVIVIAMKQEGSRVVFAGHALLDPCRIPSASPRERVEFDRVRHCSMEHDVPSIALKGRVLSETRRFGPSVAIGLGTHQSDRRLPLGSLFDARFGSVQTLRLSW